MPRHAGSRIHSRAIVGVPGGPFTLNVDSILEIKDEDVASDGVSRCIRSIIVSHACYRGSIGVAASDEDRSKGGHIGGRRASKIEAGEREHDGLVRRGCARSVPAVGLSRREVVQEKRRYQQGVEPASSEGSAFPVQAVSPPLQGQRATGKEEDAADGVGCGDALVAGPACN